MISGKKLLCAALLAAATALSACGKAETPANTPDAETSPSSIMTEETAAETEAVRTTQNTEITTESAETTPIRDPRSPTVIFSAVPTKTELR